VRFELVDSNGLLPMRAADRVFGRAVDFRRFLQKSLRPHLADFPGHDPLEGVRLPKLGTLPMEATRQCPPVEPLRLAECLDGLGQFPIDHTVGVCPTRGGSHAAIETLRSFLETRLKHYESSRNEPEQNATSGLAPYLHFGHISPHQVFAEIMVREDWSPERLAEKATGSAQGWWGTSAEAEAFLDQLIT
jgi:deoxyribodipyrimidine photo-lyase